MIFHPGLNVYVSKPQEPCTILCACLNQQHTCGEPCEGGLLDLEECTTLMPTLRLHSLISGPTHSFYNATTMLMVILACKCRVTMSCHLDISDTFLFFRRSSWLGWSQSRSGRFSEEIKFSSAGNRNTIPRTSRLQPSHYTDYTAPTPLR